MFGQALSFNLEKDKTHRRRLCFDRNFSAIHVREDDFFKISIETPASLSLKTRILSAQLKNSLLKSGREHE